MLKYNIILLGRLALSHLRLIRFLFRRLGFCVRSPNVTSVTFWKIPAMGVLFGKSAVNKLLKITLKSVEVIEKITIFEGASTYGSYKVHLNNSAALVCERTIPSDLRLSAKLLPTFDIGCHVVSVTDPLSGRSRYFFLQVPPQLYSRG
jgi:hypothetical protein